MNIAPILLAAGSSSRFGRNKLIEPLPSGVPMALASANNLLAVFERIIVVVRHGDSGTAALFESLPRVRLVQSTVAERGMSASLADGVAAAPRVAEGFLIALADMPYIAPETIRHVSAHLRSVNDIVVPSHNQQRGHPVIFGSVYREALQRITGDKGARDVVMAGHNHIRVVDVADANVLHDVDTQEQLR